MDRAIESSNLRELTEDELTAVGGGSAAWGGAAVGGAVGGPPGAAVGFVVGLLVTVAVVAYVSSRSKAH
jgi:Bacteriocin class II with double-glycine leader peptide